MSIEESFPASLTEGEEVLLRKDVLPHVKIREWRFQRIEDAILLLGHREKGYSLEVKPDEIDWEEYRRRKLVPGEELCIKKGVLSHTRTLRWTFHRFTEGDRIVLYRKGEGFLEIKVEDIDWKGCQETKITD